VLVWATVNAIFEPSYPTVDVEAAVKELVSLNSS